MKTTYYKLFYRTMHFLLDKIHGIWYNRLVERELVQVLADQGERALKSRPHNRALCNLYDNHMILWSLSTGVSALMCYLYPTEGVVMAGFLGAVFTPRPDVASIYNQNSPQYGDKLALNMAGSNTLADTQALQPGMQAGVSAQQDVLQQMLAMSQGQGPNPAMAMLQQATGQNLANQAAAAQSAPGAAMNPALAARNAAIAGAQTQQNAAQQAAVMQAQQQIAAQQGAAALGGQLVGQQQQGRQMANQVAGQLASLASNDINQFNQAQASNYKTKVDNVTSGLNATISSAKGMAVGGKVPGKAQVPGDSEANDTVHVLLSPGEIVIPRSYASNPEAAAAFAHACAMFSNKKGK